MITNYLSFAYMYPQYKSFMEGLKYPKMLQLNLLRNILKSNANSKYGQKYDFTNIHSLKHFKKEIPLTVYNDYNHYLNEISEGENNVLTSEKVLLLEPTGGATRGTKLIPYTKGLQTNFKRGIYPWLFDLYKNHRYLLRGKSYWAITPSREKKEITRGGIPIGFQEDTEYFGSIGKFLKRRMIIPPGIDKIIDIDKFYYLTLLYLVSEKELSMISVWHPSLLIILIKKLEEYWNDILYSITTGEIFFDKNMKFKPMPERAKELERANKNNRINFKRIWKNLEIISCWNDGPSQPFAEAIKTYFPKTELQGKGLLATEGIVSIPLTGLNGTVLSYRSHFFEFIDIKNQEIKNLWELEKGKYYSVILTTSGGFYRYKLRDIIMVTDFLYSVPVIKFIGKEDLIADYYGEKLNEYFVEEVIKNILGKYHLKTDFILFAPNDKGQFHYTLYISIKKRLNPKIINKMETSLDNALKDNFQYKYARHLKQIGKVKVEILNPNCKPIEKYLNYMSRKGQKIGVVKSFMFIPQTNAAKIFGL